MTQPEDAATKRSSVADAIERFVEGPERKRGVELSVVSVEGFATTDEEWQEVRGGARGVSGGGVTTIQSEVL